MVQEYLGSYVSDESGRLVFREGLLVQAVRHGWWVVLDELNLAPSEVLEALNRCVRGRLPGARTRECTPALGGCWGAPHRGSTCPPPRPGAAHHLPRLPMQAAGRQPRALCPRAAGGGAPTPRVHALCHPKPAGPLRWPQDAEQARACTLLAPKIARARSLYDPCEPSSALLFTGVQGIPLALLGAARGRHPRPRAGHDSGAAVQGKRRVNSTPRARHR